MYFVDTNFLGQMETVCPEDVFPSLWEALEDVLFVDGVIFHEEIHDELKRWNHPRFGWYNSRVRASQILSPDQQEIESYEAVSKWVAEERLPHYKRSAVDEFLNIADSWIVASAHRHGGVVVTNEAAAPKSLTKVKIPDVAQHFSVPCINSLDFLRELKVRV